MAYDDGFYYGQCKIICTTDNVEDNGKTVLVTTNDGKTFSSTLSNLRCEFMLTGRTLYKVQLVASGVAEYTTEVEAGYGDCILVHLSEGYNEVMQKDLLDLETIKNAADLTYKGASAQAVKDIATTYVNDIRINDDGKLVVRKNGADSVLNFNSILDLAPYANQANGPTFTYNVYDHYEHWRSLTTDNFIVGYKTGSGASGSGGGYATEGHYGLHVSYSVGTPTPSYNPSNGVLTITGCSGSCGASGGTNGGTSVSGSMVYPKGNMICLLKY